MGIKRRGGILIWCLSSFSQYGADFYGELTLDEQFLAMAGATLNLIDKESFGSGAGQFDDDEYVRMGYWPRILKVNGESNCANFGVYNKRRAKELGAVWIPDELNERLVFACTQRLKYVREFEKRFEVDIAKRYREMLGIK